MTTQPHSEYLTPIRKRMETLEGYIEQDLPGLDNAILDLTLRQVSGMSTGLDSAIDAYKGAMRPYYQITRKSKSGNGQSYYQRKRERFQNISRLAQESIQKQGYVIAASLVTETGYREQTVMKTLEALATEQGWEKKRDRETKSYRYIPKAIAESPSA